MKKNTISQNLPDWTSHKFILASQSPRRREILEMIGLKFQIHKSDYQENDIPNISPTILVKTHAIEKALDIAKHYSQEIIIGADTIVVIDNEILEKPKDINDARQMLKKLSGKTHKVMTGFAIINSKNQKYLYSVNTTEVTFNFLKEEIIDHYLQNYQYADKAGSYAIQDYSSIFVKKINGCFYNVVGFPIAEFYKIMEEDLFKIT